MDFPWEEHYPRLVAFAEWVIQGKNWNSGALPKGQTAETIVQDVIAKTFSEERVWEPDKGDLLTWLKWVIKSDVSHLAESASNKAEVPLGKVGEHGAAAGGIDTKPHQPSRSRLRVGSPEEAILDAETDNERRAFARAKIDSLLEACSGRPELEEIVYAISDGKCASKPQDLSEYLGKPIKEINQHLRALRRRASKIRIEAENGRR